MGYIAVILVILIYCIFFIYIYYMDILKPRSWFLISQLTYIA